MKKLLVTALAALTMLSAITPVFATGETHESLERTTVKVGYLDDYGMIITPIVQGSEGYGYEYLEKLEEYTDYEFEYVPLSWTEGLAQLESGEIDLLAPASMSEVRNEVYDFVETMFLQEETNIYALEDSDYHYGDPEQMDGKVIGTLEGSVYEERFQVYAQMHGLTCTIKHTDPATVVEDMESGKIDLYLDGSLYLREGIHSVDKLYTESLYFMTQRGDDVLNNTINSAILALEADEPYYNELLWAKYYSNAHKATQKLTADERTALQAKDVYTVGYHADLHPASYTSPDGEPMGYAIDVMNLLADKLDIKISYVPLHDGGENSAADVDFNLCTMNDESVTYGTLSEPYDSQSLLIVRDAGLAKEDVQHILVPDYATVNIANYLQEFPEATVHKTHSTTDSHQIHDAV